MKQLAKLPYQIRDEDLDGLPGGDFVIAGLKELREGTPREFGLLVLIASARLNALGLDVPRRYDIVRPVEHQLYGLLELTHANGAYSYYNSLLRTLASFLHALENRVSAKASEPEA